MGNYLFIDAIAKAHYFNGGSNKGDEKKTSTEDTKSLFHKETETSPKWANIIHQRII